MMSKHKIIQAAAALVAMLSLVATSLPRTAQAQVLPSAAPLETPSAAVLPQAPSTSVLTDDPRETYVLLAVLCFNEASGNELDCKAIGNIRARYARQRGITLREALLALHSERRENRPEYAALRSDRAQNPHESDQRAWLGDVRADLHQPHGWTGTPAEWVRTAAVFTRLYAVAQQVEAGRARDTCQGRPHGWGGPAVDAERIERLRRQGKRIIFCFGTANVFYANP